MNDLPRGRQDASVLPIEGRRTDRVRNAERRYARAYGSSLSKRPTARQGRTSRSYGQTPGGPRTSSRG